MKYHTTIFRQMLQFSSRDSLRETTDTMHSQYRKHYHLGVRAIPRSTLSDANKLRDCRIYQDLFYVILDRVQKIAPKYKLNMDRKFFVLDSTTIDLCLKLFPWARFRKTKAAVKIHTLMQMDGSLPTFLELTDNDIRFVTLKKTNDKYRATKSLGSDKEHGILSDKTILFTGHYTHKKYPDPLRLIRYRDPETKRTFEFLTNDFESDAITISKIYKARWEIEIFFKLIGYLKFVNQSKYSIGQLFHRIQVNLFERISIDEIIFQRTLKPPENWTAQCCLFSNLTGH